MSNEDFDLSFDEGGGTEETPADNDGFDYSQPVEDAPEVNFGYKTVGLVIAGILVVIAIVLILFSRMRVSTKGTPADTSNNVTVQSNEGEKQVNTSTSTSGVQLQELSSSVSMNDNAEVLTSNGRINGKKRFLYNNQVIYCLNIIVDGKNIVYFCGYNAYNTVSNNDTVSVQYKQVSDTCYVVNAISK